MITVVGEALVDLVPAGDGIEPRVGGSPLNVAVGLARLGVAVRLLTGLGPDPYGDLVRAHLEEHGVPVVAAGLAATSTAGVRVDERGDATYDLRVDTTLPDADLPPGGALHVGSLAAALAPGAATVDRLVSQARERGLPVSYDPNLRPGFVTAETPARVRALAAAADVVKLSEDDAVLLAPGTDPATTALGLLGGSTGTVVLTRGARGATAYTTTASGTHRTDAAAVPVEVVDTVGAGDAFTAGLLAARLRDADLDEQLGSALDSAAACCARAGA